MKLVIQRVTEAEVTVDGQSVGRIGRGLMVLVGIAVGDTADDVTKLAGRTVRLRVFEDAAGVMNLPIGKVDGDILAVSQFTLLADTRKGNRPSYIRAMRPPEAKELYEQYCSELERLTGRRVARGIFGADMKVSLVNDGPATLILDTEA